MGKRVELVNGSSATVDLDTVVMSGDAEPTSRVLDGSQDHGYAEEWAESGTLQDGTKVKVMYLFDDEDICDEDGYPVEAEYYPWDSRHVRRVVVI